jgi:hypothetical protein
MVLRRHSFLLLTAIAVLSGCSSSSERKSVTYAAGDKASVDKLTYSVVDSQIFPRLGDDASPRVPQNRFYVVQISVSNSGGSEAAIPAMTLIDDAGKNYDELTDGSGVERWLGVIRRVQPNQTEQGSVIFDAPAGHYKMRLTDETDASDVFVDIPLSFAHEQMLHDSQAASEAATRAGGSAAVPAKKQ